MKTFLILSVFLFALSPFSLIAQDSSLPVSGVVFNDEHEDMELDEEETRVSGATVSLFLVGSEEPFATVLTDAQGAFSFDGMAPGDYLLQVTFPSGLMVRGETFAIVAGGEPQFFPIPVIDRISAPRFTNYTLVNPANTRGENVSPFAP